MATKNSKFGQLSKADFWQGLIVAVFGAATSTIGTAAVTIADFASFEWTTLIKAFGVGAVIGLAGYLQKKIFTNSQGQFLKKEE